MEILRVTGGKKTNNGMIHVTAKVQTSLTNATDQSYEVPNKIFNISTKMVKTVLLLMTLLHHKHRCYLKNIMLFRTK
jgi:hypothetical protein